MNILMLLFKDIHYDARVKREAQVLAEAGYNVVIACLKEFDEVPLVIHKNIKLLRCQLSTKRIKRKIENSKKISSNSKKKLIFQFIRLPITKLLKDVIANREYLQIIKKELNNLSYKPDVIHCHDLNTLPTGFLLNKKFRCKLVYDSHELFNEMASKKKFEKKIGYKIEKYLIKKIDHLITVNPFLYKEFQKRYGDIPTTLIQNIPIVYPSYEEVKENYFRKKYGFLESDRILLYQGGINPERGIEKCIDAMQLLDSNYKLVLLGDGRIKSKCIEKVKLLKLENRVFFHNQVPSEKLAWYTKQADIGLVIYENTCLNNYLSTPNKVFEYLQAGIPTVASNHPGKAYIINTYKTGVTVEESPQGIKEGIQFVEKNYIELQRNCKKVRETLTWEKEGKKLIELYKNFGELS